ncbi:DUF3027 domain-containing protein [Galactobacter caseinivorans]|nr:DUF3027 domain-containing protein [Galactobacter caseinivorans]
MARTPKLDTLLAEATAEAREALAPVAPDAHVGGHLGVSADAERLVTHRFEALVPGYRGWEWYVSLARPSRGKEATVCESGIVPGPDALLAPPWVPWSDRMEPEELAAAKAASESVHGAPPEAESAETPAEPAESPASATHPTEVSDPAAPEGEDELEEHHAASGTGSDRDEDSEDDDEPRNVRGQRRRRRRKR